MGMFDNFTALVGVPEEFIGKTLQTKSLERTLSSYTILEDGFLYERHWTTGLGFSEFEKIKFSGEINFYGDVGTGWVEFYATFKDGELVPPIRMSTESNSWVRLGFEPSFVIDSISSYLEVFNKAKTQLDVKKFYKAMLEDGASKELVDSNIGYALGHCSDKVQKLWYGTLDHIVHPFFGYEFGRGKVVTPEEAFKLGEEFGKKLKAQRELEKGNDDISKG